MSDSNIITDDSGLVNKDSVNSVGLLTNCRGDRPYKLQSAAMRGIIPPSVGGGFPVPKGEDIPMTKILFVCHGKI